MFVIKIFALIRKKSKYEGVFTPPTAFDRIIKFQFISKAPELCKNNDVHMTSHFNKLRAEMNENSSRKLVGRINKKRN